MAKEFKRYLVTSALPYANGPVHIGHLAGVYIPSDIYTRYLRLRGRDVISVCGSDEHGVPITIKARKEGVTPQQIVDRYHALIKKSFEGLGMSFDIYSRTSSKTHAETASAFFRKLYDEGKFIEKTSMQYYDEEAQTFLADPVYRGDLSQVRQRPRLRRPVREVRLYPFARRTDRPAQRRVGFRTREAGDETLVPAAGPLRGIPPRMDSGRAQGVENERLRAVQELGSTEVFSRVP